MNKSILAVVIFSIIASGCSTPKVVRDNISTVKSDLDISSDSINKDGAIFVDRPPLDLTVINDTNSPAWTARYTKAINASKMPFSAIAKLIGDQGGIKTTFVDVDSAMLTSVSIPAGSTIQQALDMLAAATGYTAEVKEMSVAWRDRLIRTYDLNATGGKYSASLGSAENAGSQSQGSGDGAKQINNISSSSSQFNNVKFEGDFYDETLKAVKDMVGKKGSVSGSPLTGIIVVQAPSAVVQFTDAYMQKVQNSLRKQVRLKIRYLTFKSRLGDEKGVDWNLVYKSGRGNLMFDTGKMGFAGGSSAPAKISIKAGSGRFDGSELVVNALQEQGNVTVVTEPSLTLLNNRVGEIKLVDTTEYTQNVKVQASGDNQVSTETVKGRYNEGYTFYVLPKVTDRNEIYLQLSSDFASLNSIEKEIINEVIQKNPSVNSTAFSQSTRLAPGETLIVNGYKQTLNKNGDKTTFGIPLLAGGTSANQNVVESIVLITPVIVE
ncbi:hypothetical protein GL272_22155 [Aeromonas veronii]|uniref:hypothetical protein n=1 Tax=Aeromonas veronii TaxID=654 RepID=UPI001C5B5BCD|nr:hypothetical protein [Aeromonas veronii]MBW3779577.1 hypothetical protein [Aeromonas veronii]